MIRSKQHSLAARSRALLRGFTVVELLIVVAVIILLLSILIVAMNQVVRGAQSANTISLMSSISQGLVKFKDDHGYLPPVLTDGRGVEFTFSGYSSIHGPDPTHSDYDADVQDWYSITTLAEYLIGFGPGDEDGYGYPPDEIPTTGIRSPGGDGVWGATIYGSQDGTLAARSPVNQGKRFGPYIELKDERLLGGVDPNGNIVFPDEDPNFDTYAKVIVDYWGTPLRYLRPAYPPGALNSTYNKTTITNAYGMTVPVPSLSDVYVLRPYEIKSGAQIDGLPDEQFGGELDSGDPTSSRALLSAEFAVFSAGPDVSLTQLQRVDDEEFNRDNLVEVGP